MMQTVEQIHYDGSPGLARTTLRRSIEQSNHAVISIYRGDYAEAAVLLPISLASMKQMITWQTLIPTSSIFRSDGTSTSKCGGDGDVMREDQCDDSPSSKVSQQDQDRLNFQVVDNNWITATARLFADEAAMHEEDRVQLDQRPVLLDSLRALNCLSGEDTLKAICSCSAAIIFNLGLVIQLSAMRLANQDDTRRKLEKTMKLYELAYEIYAQNDDMLMADLTDSPTFLAIVNNLGVVHLQLEHTKEASVCFQELLSILMAMLDQGMIPEEGCGHFFHNGLVGGGHISSMRLPAPAA